MNMDRFEKQIAFLKEIDKIKNIFRQTRLLDDSRYENDAEHSWHLALMAFTLAEHANSARIDIGKVVKMVLIHDIVEIDAGDTFLYDAGRQAEKQIKEQKAAHRIFGLLPDDQKSAFLALWEEFEARESPEAKFAAALDRLEPCIQNAATHGHAWQKHGISRQQVEAANKPIADGSERMWDYVRQLIAEVDRQKFFAKE